MQIFLQLQHLQREKEVDLKLHNLTLLLEALSENRVTSSAPISNGASVETNCDCKPSNNDAALIVAIVICCVVLVCFVFLLVKLNKSKGSSSTAVATDAVVINNNISSERSNLNGPKNTHQYTPVDYSAFNNTEPESYELFNNPLQNKNTYDDLQANKLYASESLM